MQIYTGPHYFSVLDVLVVPLSGAGLKSWGCPVWDSNSLLLREKLRVVSSFPTVGCRGRVGFYGRTVSLPLLPTSLWAFSCLSGA